MILQTAALCSLLWFVTCEKQSIFLNEWAVKVTGGFYAAQRLAAEQGYLNLGEIVPGSGEYHMKQPRRKMRSLSRDRVKGPFSLSFESFKPHNFYQSTMAKLTSLPEVQTAEQLALTRRFKRGLTAWHRSVETEGEGLNTGSSYLWHLNVTDDESGMNVRQAWKLGFSGKGTRVAVVDDGIEVDHPDLAQNFDGSCSTDIVDHDDDPSPVPSFIDKNVHGTRCAGEVAAKRSSNCTIGVAFNARIGGIRLLDDNIHNDAREARALSFNRDYIDIYTNSWGPEDSGKVFGGPRRLALRALKDGVKKGRGGKGSIFIWAAGNGGLKGDDCNADGYCSSIYTITIASASESKKKPSFSESCSSILASTFSSGDGSDRAIVTTDVHHTCTNYHTGSSASAPLAAGVVALALEANANLTWRDVQHIIVKTSRPAGLKSSKWRKNGRGRYFCQEFGFGLMDSLGVVKLAKKWQTVPKQEIARIKGLKQHCNINSVLQFTFEVTKSSKISLLEHIAVPIVGSCCKHRGDHIVKVFSPSGTESVLLNYRKRDSLRETFISEWPLMSVHFWGENPIGKWKIEVGCYNEMYRHIGLNVPFLELFGTHANHNAENEEEINEDKTASVADDDQEDLVLLKKAESPFLGSMNNSTGCISQNGFCDQNSRDCLNLDHRGYARILCDCLGDCLRIEHATEPPELIFKLVCFSKLSSTRPSVRNEKVCDTFVRMYLPNYSPN